MSARLPTDEHDWKQCSCTACQQKRRACGLEAGLTMLPSTGMVLAPRVKKDQPTRSRHDVRGRRTPRKSS